MAFKVYCPGIIPLISYSPSSLVPLPRVVLTIKMLTRGIGFSPSVTVPFTLPVCAKEKFEITRINQIL